MPEANLKTPQSHGKNGHHNPNFKLFSRLPQELRLRIWKLAASSAVCQVVDIPLISTFPMPPLLYTSQEARSEPNRLYTELRIREFLASVRPVAIWLWNKL